MFVFTISSSISLPGSKSYPDLSSSLTSFERITHVNALLPQFTRIPFSIFLRTVPFTFCHSLMTGIAICPERNCSIILTLAIRI
jgi:hypothetical protein